MLQYLRFSCLFLLCSCTLLACNTEPNFAPGVLALVNGQAITLHQVETYHDANGSAPFILHDPSVGILQEQYGKSLGSLILLALLEQELKRQNLTITPEEIDAVEARIRNDYPPGMFQYMLETDFIGLEAWRELLQWRLLIERFTTKILRPTIEIDAEEIRLMYQEQQDLFLRPARSRLLVISGSKKGCEAAREQYIQTQKIIESEDADIYLERVQLAESRMPRTWLKEIQGKEIGTVTPVFEDGGMWTFCVLKERTEATQVSMAEAFTLLESLVLDTKLSQAFENWFRPALDKSVIFVSPHLREASLGLQDTSSTDTVSNTESKPVDISEQAPLQEEK